jgi:mycothiol synthase
MPVPPGYILRHPVGADLPAAQAVLDAAEAHDTGRPRRHERRLATDWEDPRSDPGSDWWVIVAPGGMVAGVAWVWPQTRGEVTADHYVHPVHRGIGIGDALLDAIEARVAELSPRRSDGAARSLIISCEDSDVVRLATLGARGFSPVRQYYEMATDLRDEPPHVSWPAGTEPRAFRPGVDERHVWAADLEAFLEHYLFEARGFDEWRLHHLEGPESDPSLWWLAWDGDELAGYVIPSLDGEDAEIRDLAVRKPWRGRGIGRALLLAAFGTLRGRGSAAVRLYVDAQNVTGAVRVYEAAGMRVARRFDVMEKPLA